MSVLINDIPLGYFLICLLGGYILGSLPFGIILTQAAGQGDLRKVGSGNIGATNVLRTGNKPLALATLLLDGAKGALAVLIAYLVFNEADLAYFAGGGAFLGHLYSIFLKFKGGKGVATSLGTLLAINWPLGFISCLIWGGVMLIFRMSSLSALVASALSPLISYVILGNSGLAIFAGILCIMIFIRHADNIKRILSGTEPRVSKK